jgi:hypothetical protein
MAPEWAGLYLSFRRGTAKGSENNTITPSRCAQLNRSKPILASLRGVMV